MFGATDSQWFFIPKKTCLLSIFCSIWISQILNFASNPSFQKDLADEHKEHSPLFAGISGKICRYLFCEEKSLFSLPVWFPFSQKKNKNKKLLKKRGRGRGKQKYYSRIIWKRPWEEHFSLQELLVACFISWCICLLSPSIPSFLTMLPGP